MFNRAEIFKVDTTLGLIFGYAIVCKQDGKPYVDRQNDHIPEASMMEAALEFAKSDRQARSMHDTDDGQILFMLPMTTELAKALDISVKKTGLIVAMKPENPETLAKAARGELTGFSIGGMAIASHEEEM